MKKKLLTVLLVLSMLAAVLYGCAEPQQEVTEPTQIPALTEITVSEAETQVDEKINFTDSIDRKIEVPSDISRIAPSGSVAQMILLTLAPDLLVGLSSTPDEAQLAYLPKEAANLPEFGQFYGGKANLNMEALIAANPQIIIDIGNRNNSIAEDMDMVQEQTGIPTVFIDGELSALPQAYRMLGKLLNREDDAEKLAAFIENTLAMAEENANKISEDDKKTVFFGTGTTGLECNAAGSAQADAIELIGAINAIVTEEITNKNGGTVVNMEQVYASDPDIIIMTPDGVYDTVESSEWASLTAVENGAYYEIPSLPYSWMCMPPSVNRVLGIWWLGKLIYPEVYDYDIVPIVQEYYQLFWHYDLSDTEAEGFLAHSSLK